MLIVDGREKVYTREKLMNETFLQAARMFDRGMAVEMYKTGVVYGIYRGRKINVFFMRDRGMV